MISNPTHGERIGKAIPWTVDDLGADAVRKVPPHVETERRRQCLDDEWENKQDADERVDGPSGVADDRRQPKREEPEHVDVEAAPDDGPPRAWTRNGRARRRRSQQRLTGEECEERHDFGYDEGHYAEHDHLCDKHEKPTRRRRESRRNSQKLWMSPTR